MPKEETLGIRCDCMNTETVDMGSLGENTAAAKRSLLLHSCCGPCSTACIERLLPDFKVTVFFYNPNITEAEEYELRKANQIKFIEEFNLTVDPEDQVCFIEGEYLPEDFFEVCSGFSNEPEGGLRCTECFKLRLNRAAQVAQKEGYSCFGTTLTVSPHKNYPLISAIGKEFETVYGVQFLDMDFKKKAGFQRSIELSKEYGLYRQNYCGCIYSNWTLKKDE